MNRKLKKLAVWCFLLALVIFAVTYVMFHYMTPEGTLTMVRQEGAGKPFVTLLFGIWGVLFLFGSVMSLLAARIVFPERN